MVTSTLVVIDMQPRFEAATYPFVVAAVCQAMARARQKNQPIILVEYSYEDYDRHSEEAQFTHWKVARGVLGYENAVVIEKDNDDGSDEIIRTCEKYEFPLNFQLCGVNGSACVEATALGLVSALPDSQVAILKKAVANPKGWRPPLYWMQYEWNRHPNLVVA